MPSPLTDEGALSDVRVVDISQVLSGPVCTAFLADLGADVVKVEPPETGEPFRSVNRELDGEPFSPLFELYNRNKRSVSLDIKSDEGAEALGDLVADADVFVQNFGPGTAERLGVDEETMRGVNEDLVYVRISGYGEEGPLAGRPAFDGLIQHSAGFSSLHGFEGDPPILAQSWLTDYFSGYNAALEALAALHHRENGGGGQACSVSMFASLLHNMNGVFEYHNNLGETPGRAGTSGLAHNAELLYGSVEVADGWIGVAFLVPYPNIWRGFCELVDRPDLLEADRFATPADRRDTESLRELNDIFRDWLADRGVDEAVETLNEHSIPASRHRTIPEVPEMDHVQAVDAFREVDHPRFGELTLTDTPLSLSETPAEIRAPAPVLGADSRDVLSEAGYTSEEIDRLVEAGVLEDATGE